MGEKKWKNNNDNRKKIFSFRIISKKDQRASSITRRNLLLIAIDWEVPIWPNEERNESSHHRNEQQQQQRLSTFNDGTVTTKNQTKKEQNKTIETLILQRLFHKNV